MNDNILDNSGGIPGEMFDWALLRLSASLVFSFALHWSSVGAGDALEMDADLAFIRDRM